jgi:hypothetical protein
MITELRYQMKCGEQGVHELPAAEDREKGGKAEIRCDCTTVIQFLSSWVTQQGAVLVLGFLPKFAPPLSNHHDLFRKNHNFTRQRIRLDFL